MRTYISFRMQNSSRLSQVGGDCSLSAMHSPRYQLRITYFLCRRLITESSNLLRTEGRILTKTVGKRVWGAPRLGNPGVLPVQVVLRGAILPLGDPAQWSPVKAGPNTGLIPQTLTERVTRRNLDPLTQ